MASIQGVYIALFGRPADPLGLAFFNSATNNGANLTAIGDLASTAEYQNRFTGQTSTQIITTIYRSLFNRDPDLAGLTFFATALANGTLSINNIAIAIFDGAQGSDITIRDLKVSAANAFTAQIDTVAEINGYSGTAAAQSGVAFIAGVTTTAPTAAQVSNAVATAVAAGGPAGTVFTLVAAADNIVGTAGNDTINGLADTTAASGQTLTAIDKIAGGSGVDTFNVTVAGTAPASAFNGADVTGVEVVNIRALVATAFDASTTSGLTAITADRGPAALTLTNVAAGTSVGIIGNGATSVGALSATYANAATSSTLELSGGIGGTAPAVTIAGTGLTSQVVNSTGAANTIGAFANSATVTSLTINANSNLTTGAVTGAALATITATGGGNVNLSATAVPTTVTSVNASALTGNLTVTSGANTTSVTGGSGNDVVSIGTLVYNASGKLDGGTGTDTLSITDSTATLFTAAAKANITGFETLAVGGANKTFDFTALTGVTSLVVNAATSAIVNKLGAATPVTVAGDQTTNLTLNVTDATGPLNSSDSLTVTLDKSGTDTATSIVTVADITSDGLETLNIVSKGVLGNVAGGTDDNVITTLAGLATSNVNKIVITGGSDLTATTGAIGKVINIDGTAATGNLTISGAANGSAIAISGGTGADTLTGGAGTDVLNGGAGNDKLDGGAGLDTLTGGTGTNNFIFANTSTGLPSSTAFDTISDFRAGTANTIDFGAIVLAAVAGGSGAAGQASVSANGVATFNVADSTLALQLTAVAAAATASGGASTAGESIIWQNGSDAYLFVSDTTDGLSATDVLIKLTGVTVATGGLTFVGGDITAIA